jgi:hypothetical protein
MTDGATDTPAKPGTYRAETAAFHPLTRAALDCAGWGHVLLHAAYWPRTALSPQIRTAVESCLEAVFPLALPSLRRAVAAYQRADTEELHSVLAAWHGPTWTFPAFGADPASLERYADFHDMAGGLGRDIACIAECGGLDAGHIDLQAWLNTIDTLRPEVLREGIAIAGLTAARPVADDWVTVTRAAEDHLADVDGITFETAKATISQACSDRRIRCTGKGRQRRIDPESLATWRLSRREHDLERSNAAR